MTGSFEAATAPEIITQPVSGVFQKDATGKTLTVSATPSTGECAYQWYSCDDAEGTNESSLGESAQTATYTVPTGTEGTYYYFCRVSDDGSNTTDTDIATVRILDRAPKQTWDVTEINYEDVKYNTTFWTETGANRTYRHDFEKNTYGTLQDNYGNDLLNGIQVIRPDGTLPLYLYCGSPYFGINAQGGKSKPAKFIVPVEDGKYYEVTYTSKDKGKEVGYLVAGATIVSGDNTRAFGADESWTKITFLVQATSTSMTLTNTAGETDGDANSCTLISIKEVAALVGAWSAGSGTIYKGDATPTPSFSVTASNGDVLDGSDYTVVYSLKDGSDDGLITIPVGGASFTLNNDVTGTATLIATLTSADEEAYLTPASNTYEYVYTVNAKTPTITLNKADNEISLRSTPVHRDADTDETATVTMEGAFLEGTSGTVSIVESVDGLSISPSVFTITDGSVGETVFTITYNSASGASGEATVRFSDGTNTKDLVIEYASVVAHEWATVTESTTWDWTTTSSTVQLKDDGSTTPAKAEDKEINAADFDGECNALDAKWPEGFNAAALILNKAEFVTRGSNHYYQGHIIKLKTSVPGTINVKYSSTGSKSRDLYINGSKYGETTSSTTYKESGEVAVAAGDIVISGMETDGSVSNYLHIEKIVFTAAPASVAGTITAANWNTFSSNYPLDLSTISGGTAYVAKSAADGKVVMTECTNKVAAGTGLMIKGTADAEFSINTTADATTAPEANLLVGLPNGGEAPVGSYVFGWPSEDATAYGFYYVDSAAAALGAGKAYLDAGGSVGARLSFIFDDEETTGITDNKRDTITNNGEYFNLAGQKVAQPTKGLYIVNGRKVVVR
ncbi:MAG: hypothetical protein IJ155_02880 [Prevotella sp.]|nr:hypothetical protein [Prevotella sp.]